MPRAQAVPGQPALPDLPECATSYQRFEMLKDQMAAELEFEYVHQHLDPVPLETELEHIPEDVIDIYFAYYVFFRPEYLSHLDDDEQATILKCWTDRDFRSLY